MVEDVAKRKKALNHEGHEEHKEELFFSFLTFVSFVVRGFYAFCDNLGRSVRLLANSWLDFYLVPFAWERGKSWGAGHRALNA